ncbi:hypothetical protein [Desulfotalea psychrophila]|uniref:Uncharacterized protein n=1 Tax=Desulfotalea psychrophila (strain LSv54 / DSM 12343) TaxID=177439 RepID=Q6AM77_DESPS|nr:hypothetical protein [Desulfotalea psychrophila]CAG36548.1 unknown protein [Desulfotalea psychrophila LSv54]
MIPLNYAILKFFTKNDDASADCVMSALQDQYGHYKAFKKGSIINAIMTAEANGLLEEARLELDPSQELKVYYRAHEEGAATINKYIKG